MKNLWKLITGEARQEKQWAELPRLLPEEFRNIPAGDDAFVFGPEYIDPSRKSVRRFLAGVADEKGWKVCSYERNFKKDPDSVVAYRTIDPSWRQWWETYGGDEDEPRGWHATQAEDLVAVLKNKSEEFYKEWIPVQPASETYTAFAYRHGINFDSDGRSYMPTVQDTVRHSVLLHGKALTAVFESKQSDRIDRLRQWEGLIDALSVPLPSDEVIMRETRKMEQLKSYKEILGNMERSATLQQTGKNVLMSRGMCQSEELHGHIQSAFTSSLILHMLDAASRSYQEVIAGGISNGRDKLKNIYEDLTHIESLAERCGFHSTEAVAMKDVIMTGRRPQMLSPLEALIQRYETLLQNKPGPKPGV